MSSSYSNMNQAANPHHLPVGMMAKPYKQQQTSSSQHALFDPRMQLGGGHNTAQQTPGFHPSTGYGYQSQLTQNQLNPSVPGFRPTGNEMERYLSNPPGSSAEHTLQAPINMMQLQQYVVGNHFSHEMEISRIERKLAENEETIKNMQEMNRRDIRVLENQILVQNEQLAAHTQQQSALTGQRLSDQDVTPTLELLGAFSNETIAKAYVAEAEDYEKTATKLREKADELSGAFQRKTVSLKLLNAPQHATKAEIKHDFVCCGNPFETSQALVDHVDKVHVSSSQITQPNHQSTRKDSALQSPTHLPPHHVRPEKHTRAVEIKQPVELTQPQIAQSKTIAKDIQNNHADTLSTPATNTTVAKQQWLPLAVREMPSPKAINIEKNVETFTWEFIKESLGGDHWSPGFYFAAKNKNLPSKSYWVLEAAYEPFLPSQPGKHGAKLTAFFNNTYEEAVAAPDEESYQNTPVFVRAEGQNEYIYFGNYSQLRFSDKLDYDSMFDHVPEKVRQYWAEQLTDEKRPEWVTHCLMAHFWPKPTYDGDLPADDSSETPSSTGDREDADEKRLDIEAYNKRVARKLNEYAKELIDWEVKIKVKAWALNAGDIMASFGHADADEEPGLRLWWEYMQFTDYDQKFYDMLVDFKGGNVSQATTLNVDVAGAKGPKTVEQNVNGESSVHGKIVKPVNGVETLHPAQNRSQQPKPNERPAKEVSNKPRANNATNTATGLQGDVTFAKKLQEEHKKGGRTHTDKKGGQGKGGNSSAPPHLRGR